jgi:hypothetical protein
LERKSSDAARSTKHEFVFQRSACCHSICSHHYKRKSLELTPLHHNDAAANANKPPPLPSEQADHDDCHHATHTPPTRISMMPHHCRRPPAPPSMKPTLPCSLRWPMSTDERHAATTGEKQYAAVAPCERKPLPPLSMKMPSKSGQSFR